MTTLEQAPPVPTPASFRLAPLFTGLVGIAVMVLFAHGCHNHDADLEPSVVPSRVDGPHER